MLIMMFGPFIADEICILFSKEVFKKTLAYLLLLTLIFQCLGSLGVLAWFQVNRSYIANVLCENRDKPAMHCNGQCVLMKKLKKLDESGKNSQDTSTNKAEVRVLVPQYICLPHLVPKPLNHSLPPYRNQYTYLFVRNLFLPPKIA